MAIPGIQEIQSLATKYSKTQLQQMAQRGLIDPTKAVMAGMMIDRIQKQNMQMPQQTVADEVLGANVLSDRFGNAVRSGSGQAVRTGVEQDRFGNVIRPNEKQSAGMTALPSGLPEEMAGGGLVAFAEGGDVPGYADRGLVSAADAFRRSGMSPDQLAEMFASAGPGVPVAPAQSEPQGVMLPGGLKLRDYPVRPEPTLQQEIGAITEAEKAVGLDDEALFKQLGEEDKARREELKGRKDQAFGNVLIMGGLGLMGAREGEEFEVLSTVGRQGVMQYGAAMKEIRETENDIRKSERALLLAKNQLKRDKSAKAKENYDNKQKAFETAKENAVTQYNDSIKTLANLNEKYISGERQSATQLAVAQINRSTQLATAGMGETSQMAERVLADMRKTNPNATYGDAVGVVRGLSKSGAITDKELQDAYEARLKDLVGKKAREEFLSKYPTWREFAAEQRGQPSAGASTAGGANRPSLSSFDKP